MPGSYQGIASGRMRHNVAQADVESNLDAHLAEDATVPHDDAHVSALEFVLDVLFVTTRALAGAEDETDRRNNAGSDLVATY